MKQTKLSRRHFLQGVGGATLALPFLPSLLTRAEAADGPPRALIYTAQGHGGFHPVNFYPNAVATQYTRGAIGGISESLLYPNYYVRKGELNNLKTVDNSPLGNPEADPDAGQARLSRMLGSFMNPYLTRMNMYRGVDQLFNPEHSVGQFLGNQTYTNGEPNRMPGIGPFVQSLDHTIAAAPGFYPQNPRLRTVGLGRWSMSFAPANPSTRAGQYYWPNELFDALFPDTSGQAAPNRTFLIDRVLEDYRRVTRSAYGPAARMSGQDRNRIDQFVSLLTDLQRRLAPTTFTCQPMPRSRYQRVNYDPNEAYYDPTYTALYWQHMIEIITIALSCGATRIATIGIPDTMSTNSEIGSSDFHNHIAHAHTNPERQRIYVRSQRRVFEYLLKPLLQTLDSMPSGAGGSLLDQSLVVYQNEAGPTTHLQREAFLMSFGSAGGRLNTGQYHDFRNLDNHVVENEADVSWARSFPGLPLQRWWVSVMRAMGLAPEDYANPGGVANGYANLVIPVDANGNNVFRSGIDPNYVSPRTGTFTAAVLGDRMQPLPQLLR